MTALQWGVAVVGCPAALTLGAWVTSIRVWRRRNRDGWW